MTVFGLTPGEWFVLVQHELLLFAAFFFLFGAIDEFAVDLSWIWLRLTGRTRSPQIGHELHRDLPLDGDAAVFLPAWQEEEVIGSTIAHLLQSWPQRQLRLYVGCYPNDRGTLEAAMKAASGDPRVRIVIQDEPGPTTKAGCLNRLYASLCEDERRSGRSVQMVVLHDAEDLVDPIALPLLDRALQSVDFVQLPVVPLPQAGSRWVGGHYCEEFAEAHGKAMVVRDAIGAALPAAGVGCAIARAVLGELARQDAAGNPFDASALTEDYELGLRVAELGGRSRFLRLRDHNGRLIATRSYFPATLEAAVRQKTRWLHGIAFQGWENMGWGNSAGEAWMRLRDRRGPVGALLLFIAYLLLAMAVVTFALELFGLVPEVELSSGLKLLLWINLAMVGWRALWRFGFTTAVYGWKQGVMAVLRIPVANVIAIMAARRAMTGYLRSLAGDAPRWDKTSHDRHPAAFPAALDAETLRVPKAMSL